jgi:lactate racemase
LNESNGAAGPIPEVDLPQFIQGVQIPAEGLLYSIAPAYLPAVKDAGEAVLRSLREPTGSAALRERVRPGDKVLIIADDITRPTPQRVLLPPLVDELKQSGVRSEDMEILIALGTHRPMTEEEIRRHFGAEIAGELRISNHEFSDPAMVLDYGSTDDGTPITVNRRVAESDFVIGVSSVVPHAQVGWGGGCKIVLPGVSGERTVEAMHMMAARMPDYPRFAGQVENPVRSLIEEVAQKAGLDFILNVVFNTAYEIVELVAGDPVRAHRKGVEIGREIFIRDIPSEADIVLCNAHPADLEYWQGLKPLTLSSLGVREGGIIVLAGDFPDGVSQSHDELERYGGLGKKDFEDVVARGEIENGLCLGALYQHVLVRERVSVYCVAKGLSPLQKKHLGFLHFATIQEALDAALDAVAKASGKRASVGIIDQGGEVVPRVRAIR